MTSTYLKMGDESYCGLNGLRVDYKDAMQSYELSVKEDGDPRAHLMLALCYERVYPLEREDIAKALKKAATRTLRNGLKRERAPSPPRPGASKPQAL